MQDKVIGHVYTPSSNIVIIPIEEVAKIAQQLGCNTYWLLNKHGGLDVQIHARTSVQIAHAGNGVLVTRRETK